LIHQAAGAFPRVALYFESSILPADLPLLGWASSSVTRAEQSAGKLVVESPRGTGIAWKGSANVDGRPWPVLSDDTLWLPSGAHSIEPALKAPLLRLTGFSGELKSALATAAGFEFSYSSSARAFATVDRLPKRIEIDGAEAHPQIEGNVLLLPRGQHLVSIER
jgi:hypothetical protein